jgi:2-hydroxy-6-oxonona-2,4-dienedioate hydrolase
MDVRQRNLIREDEYKSIKAPTLIFGSTSDRESLIEKAKKVADVMPSATMAVTHDVGHWPHWEKPEEFNKLAIDFLR